MSAPLPAGRREPVSRIELVISHQMASLATVALNNVQTDDVQAVELYVDTGSHEPAMLTIRETRPHPVTGKQAAWVRHFRVQRLSLDVVVEEGL